MSIERPLKIVQAIDAGGWGGAEKVVVTLANGLNDEGHDVEVWVRKNSVLCDELTPTVKIRIVPFLNDFEPFTPLLFMKALKRHDIVHVHLGRAARLSGYITPFLSNEARRRLICHMHLYHKPKHYTGQRQIICVSKAVQMYIKDSMPWVERSWVVYNGIDIEKAPKANPLIAKDGHLLRIGLLATFKAQKGHSDLLKAFSKICDRLPIELILGGEGPLLPEMKQLARELDISEKVNFLGFVEPELAFSFWRSLDIACIPSNAEGFCLSLLEAMACGLPIVGYAEAAISEVANDAGILVPMGDIDALSAALERVIEGEELRAHLGNLSLERSRLFTHDAMIKETLKVYEEVLQEK